MDLKELLKELKDAEPLFCIVEEPDFSREKLLEFQRKYGINTLNLFEHISTFGTVPMEISERDLALWKHYYCIFQIAEGDPWELLEYDEEGFSPPLLFLSSLLYEMPPVEKWCNAWACK